MPARPATEEAVVERWQVGASVGQDMAKASVINEVCLGKKGPIVLLCLVWLLENSVTDLQKVASRSSALRLKSVCRNAALLELRK